MTERIIENDNIWLKDVMNMNIAQFLVIRYDHDDSDKYIFGFPTMGIIEYYKDARNPLSYLSGGVQWNIPGFLGWIGNICSDSERMTYPLILTGYSNNMAYTIQLTRKLSLANVEQIAALLGTPIEIVRKSFQFHLTFPELGV